MVSSTLTRGRSFPAIVTLCEKTAALTCSAIKTRIIVLNLIAHSSFGRQYLVQALPDAGKFIPCRVVLVLKKVCQKPFCTTRLPPFRALIRNGFFVGMTFYYLIFGDDDLFTLSRKMYF